MKPAIHVMKKHISNSVLLCAGGLLIFLSSPADVFSQGCVIARGAGSAMILEGEGFLEAHQWQASVSYRYFHSHRHFVGTEEQYYREDEDTQVENHSHFIDLTATYAVTKRIWLNLTVPFVYHDRSSLYEHDRMHRYHTQSGGLADVRLTGIVWLLNPDTYHAGNFAVGVGLKAPTGDYKATDIFMRPDGPTLRYVDSSIQPGDGGWGIVLEAQGFHHIVGNANAYLNASYLINPREMVPDTGFSVPDSYLLRGGVDYAIWPSQGLSLSLGGRVEGVPPQDAIGGSLGRRRPGYIVSIEPGITYTHGKFSATITAPVAVIRNRQQSYPESLRPDDRHGDAAFADYTINASFAYRF